MRPRPGRRGLRPRERPRLSFECPWGYEAKLEEEGAPGWDLHTMADTPGQPSHEGKRRVCRPREG